MTMHDPYEGVSALGTIETGASRDRVPAEFEPVLQAATTAVSSDVSLYVYGSVATGMAQPPQSDVDLLTVGLPAAEAAALADALSARFSGLCRSVEVAAARSEDFIGPSDEAYGGRVFLRHYCVHLSGPDPSAGLPAFAADSRAARGFNGDIAHHLERWRTELDAGTDPALLSRRLARKSLLAVAGLVSVHDKKWTTDRTHAAIRWGQIEPTFAADLKRLLSWSRGGASPEGETIGVVLDGVVTHIRDSFTASIGLWGGR